jgi:hypothetical protein
MVFSKILVIHTITLSMPVGKISRAPFDEVYGDCTADLSKELGKVFYCRVLWLQV